MTTQTTGQQPSIDWRLWVGGGYGHFDFHGTEAEAEQMRIHKARWESAVAFKWRASDPEPAIVTRYHAAVEKRIAEANRAE